MITHENAAGAAGRPLARLSGRWLAWLRHELQIARRETQDAQFLATVQGDGYEFRT